MKISIIYTFLIIVTSLLFSCNEKENSTSKPIIKNVTPEKIIKHNIKHTKHQEKEYTLLTNDNVKSELLRLSKINKENIVLLKTRFGNMKIKLYKNTILHKSNFINLIKRGYYDKTIFYRVVEDFVIQGGDSDDNEISDIKRKIGNYTIPSEFNDKYFHKKGALSMVRGWEKNPLKRSVSYDFFIVKGTIFTDKELNASERKNEIKIPEYKRKYYRTIGGTPHLDGEHTVFGEVIEGLNIIDTIAKQKVDNSSWPDEDIFISMEIIK